MRKSKTLNFMSSAGNYVQSVFDQRLLFKLDKKVHFPISKRKIPLVHRRIQDFGFFKLVEGKVVEKRGHFQNLMNKKWSSVSIFNKLVSLHFNTDKLIILYSFRWIIPLDRLKTF